MSEADALLRHLATEGYADSVADERPRLGVQLARGRLTGPAKRAGLKIKTRRISAGVVRGTVVGCTHKETKSGPSGYVPWFGWAERKAQTHDQLRCPSCDLYAIWVRKEKR